MRNPSLKEKLEKAGVSEFLWFSKWLQTLFTYQFDLYFSMKMFDIILVKGIDSIIDISLLMIDFIKDRLEPLEEIDQIVKEIDSLYSLNENTLKLIKHIQINLQ
jgi:hypothetical protein